MRKEFVVKSINMPPYGGSFVIVSLTSVKDFQEGTKPQFDPSKTMNPSDMNSMIKDLNKMLSGVGGMVLGGVTSLKIDIKEYKEMNLSVGDRVYLDLTKAESSGI